MKKVLTSLLVCSILLCCMFMTACSPVGTYKFYRLSYSQNGIEMEIEAGEAFMGVTITEDFLTLELKDDGTGSMTTQGTTVNITWTEEDDEIKVSSSGNTQIFKKDGRKLSVQMDGYTIVLKKWVY